MTDLSEEGAAFEVRGPSASVPSVEAWAPAYIPYEPRGESRRLRDELRRMIGGLRARDGEILHCAFSGWKPDNADIENVLLYNVHDSGGCFRGAVGEGLRFELVHADPPPTPSGDRSGSHYSYRLVPAGHGFAGWRLGAEFASWRSVDLGQLAGPKTLEGVWWALRHSDVPISAVERASNMPFSVSLTLHPPVGHTVNPASLLKGCSTALCARSKSTGTTELSTQWPPALRSTSMRLVLPSLPSSWMSAEQSWEGCLGSSMLVARACSGGRTITFWSRDRYS